MALFTLKGAEYIVSFITLPYLLHILGPEKFGGIVFVQSLVNYGNLLTDFGFNITAPRDIAQSDIKRIKKEFSTILIAKVILLFLTLLIGGLLVRFFKDQLDVMLVVCIIPSLVGNALFPMWYYQGIQQMKYITIFNMIARISSVVGIFYLVKQPEDYCLAALLQSSIPLLSATISLSSLFFYDRQLFCIPALNSIFIKYREGWEIFISTVFINLYTNSNIVILRLLTNDTCVGYYSAANKIIEVIKGALMPISNAIFPHVSVLVQESRENAIVFLRRIVRIIGGISFVLSLIIFLSADSVVQLIMGAAYGDSVQLLMTISFLPFIIGLSNVFGIQTMVAFGMQTLFSRILMMSVVLNFLLVFPMVYYWQAMGMAVTVVIVECFVTVIMYWMLHRKGIELIR